MNIKYICMEETNYSSSNIEYSHNNIRIIDFICVTLPQIPVLHFETRMGIEHESGTVMKISGTKETHPKSIVVADADLNNVVYSVYAWPAVCTVQLINTSKNTWRQAGLSLMYWLCHKSNKKK